MNVAIQAYEKARHAVRYFLLRRLPTCKRIAPLISESLERPLTLRERVLLRLHLYVCVWCVWYLNQLRALRTQLLARGRDDGALTEHDEVALTDDARERIRRALREAAK